MALNGEFSLPSGTRSKSVAKPSARSRVSNGKDLFLDGVDGRSVLARRYRDILAQLVSDVGGDPSEAQSLIVRRATTLAVELFQKYEIYVDTLLNASDEILEISPTKPWKTSVRIQLLPHRDYLLSPHFQKSGYLEQYGRALRSYLNEIFNSP